ncbi:MAG: MMPL family transporter [Candidatus Limnocylindrales bacterium]
MPSRPADDPQRVAEAVRVTVATAGRAVFFSGLTVLLGLLGLVLFEFMILRSVGIAGAIVVGLAVLAALTLLPAVLLLIGSRLDRFAVRRVAVGTNVDGPWARLARWVMRRPVVVLIPTLAVLLVLGSPFLHVRFNAPDASILPPNVPSRAAFDRLTAEFGEGEFAPLTLAVRTVGDATSPDNLGRLYDYSRRLAADPRVVRVESLVDVDRRLSLQQYRLLYGDPNGPRDRFVATALSATTNGDLTAFTVFTPYGPNRDEGRALVRAMRDPNSGLAPPAGVTVQVGGGAADVSDVVDRVAADFPRTALFIVVTTYLVLFALLRSVVLPAKALVMNTLSIAASFGALVWIFQDGNLSAILGFQPLGFVETTQPVILFCVLFGLSMDYEVFLLSRMKEVWDRTGDNTEAVARGLERSGRIVTSAALIVVARRGLVRVCRHRADQGPRHRHGDRRRARRDRRPRAARAGHDAPPRPLELVDAGQPGTIHRRSTAGVRGGDRSRHRSGRPMRYERAIIALAICSIVVLTGCTAGSPILAAPSAPRPSVAPPTPAPIAVADPQPVVLPRDDGPHDRLTEWWYYTGHLRAADGRSFGFEYVIFRAERGAFPDDLGLAPGRSRTRPATPSAMGSASRSGREWIARRGTRRAARRASTWPSRASIRRIPRRSTAAPGR